MLPTPPDKPQDDAPNPRVIKVGARPEYVDADGLAWWFDLPPVDVVADRAKDTVRVRTGVGWREFTPEQARRLAAALVAAAYYCDPSP